jgi:hypothetical protein
VSNSNPNPNQSSSQSSPEKIHETIFRVNRLSQQIFLGNRKAFEIAIRARRIKADDLIFDEDSQTWIFARQHDIFIELLGQTNEKIRKYKKKKFDFEALRGILISILLLSAFLFVIIRYSKEIQFKQSEASGEFTESSNTNQKGFLGESSKKGKGSKGEGKGGDEDEGGDGNGNNSGNDDIAGSSGKGQGVEGQEEPQTFKPKKENIEMVFDLDADGMKQAIQFVQESQFLDDATLLLKARKIKNTKITGREALDLIQKGMAYASFVLNRSLQQKRRPHRGAEIILEQLKERLNGECMQIYKPSFCDIKTQHPQWNESSIHSILKKKVMLGMTLQQAEMAWKRADRVMRVENGRKYCYGKDCDRFFWLSGDGLVTQVLIP